jgi:hypothetical protein
MMSLETINSTNRERALESAKFRHVPYMVWPQDIVDWKAGKGLPIPFPHLGDYVPDEYELDGDAWMVDTSGFGSPNEPALTLDQLLDKLVAGRAYAFVEVGQFQAYLQQFKKVQP